MSESDFIMDDIMDGIMDENLCLSLDYEAEDEFSQMSDVGEISQNEAASASQISQNEATSASQVSEPRILSHFQSATLLG